LIEVPGRDLKIAGKHVGQHLVEAKLDAVARLGGDASSSDDGRHLFSPFGLGVGVSPPPPMGQPPRFSSVLRLTW